MRIRLSKYHGNGNDFLVVWPDELPSSEGPRFSRQACRRHRGVGADGCVFVMPTDGKRFTYRIFNADGSEAGMSGNGARCAAAYLNHHEIVRDRTVELDTRAGVKTYHLLEAGEGRWTYRSEMGAPDFDPASIPCDLESNGRLVGVPLEVAGEELSITAFSMGNPQCQVLMDQLPDPERFRRLGAGLEKHRVFPDRANVGFVKAEGPNKVRLSIWERGVGPTLSSGTGSCAAAVTAVLHKVVESPVEVVTESGSQTVEWTPGGPVSLTGDAEFVADVEYFYEIGT